MTPEQQDQHALDLLREAFADDPWHGVAQLPIDDVCKFGASAGEPCGVRVDTVTVLEQTDGVHAVVTCSAHAEVIARAVTVFRALKGQRPQA